eukprot:5868212-Lingulodinium_polyedra.AAC.1
MDARAARPTPSRGTGGGASGPPDVSAAINGSATIAPRAAAVRHGGARAGALDGFPGRHLHAGR